MRSLPSTSVTLLTTLLSLGATTTATPSPNCANSTNPYTLYPVTTNITIPEIAARTNRSLCDIARHNLMADPLIPPNIGQTIVIPPLSCASSPPDNESCLIPNITRTALCINGGPRLYYTVHGDTYDIIARRLNISTAALMGNTSTSIAATSSADALLEVGQFIKVPLCEPSQCSIKPFTLEYGVYKDLADEYGTTVGQIMMLSPTYNYSTSLVTGNTRPTLDLPFNCSVTGDDVVVVD
ncbi:hypothetical protein ASPACDRAFT_47520 [Aspergillus aculeatus ATCC 16872]|uniref:LysM domain-containing protein n=1 Tax=Aspergillus aculeatus (strain ATCC 16872 / CBS 172.66 / WB 5094) TaxID=690307 RepID=A0A1L9WHK1_ASPA1|nr:uncharacterized protein ASPACDRAFT_47520 [Aspergillus aculeatus ATCC 16872]OJJ95630.1 hypothetical protein ASPACDRAFT_47520 [Aspergillus aculeatus ATCC 16872]